MEVVKRELIRHLMMINHVWEVVYANPIHLRGKSPYRDKKKLWDLRERVRSKKQLLRRRDLQFLENLFVKYSR